MHSSGADSEIGAGEVKCRDPHLACLKTQIFLSLSPYE
jgi:hypothetical protein